MPATFFQVLDVKKSCDINCTSNEEQIKKISPSSSLILTPSGFHCGTC